MEGAFCGLLAFLKIEHSSNGPEHYTMHGYSHSIFNKYLFHIQGV